MNERNQLSANFPSELNFYYEAKKLTGFSSRVVQWC